jgi:hypothetical protein
MSSRLATIVFAAAAAFAGAGLSAHTADSRPVQVDPFAQLQAENARLRRDVDAYRDALDDIDRINQRNRDRGARRAIDRVLGGLQDQGRDRDRRDHDDRDAPRLLSSADFSTLLAHVTAASFDQNKLDLVRAIAPQSVFTVDQVVALMQTSSFDETRIEIAATLRPRIVDPARWYLVYDALTFSSSRDTLRQRVGQ